MLKKIIGFLQGMTYQSRLEEYVASKHPQNTGDVERYTLEYQRASSHWA
jgi:hypothetical protein